jgi:hypothetical protein
MPDLLNFQRTVNPNGVVIVVPPTSQSTNAGVTTITAPAASVFSCPVVRVAGKVVSSTDHSQVASDFTGANDINFAFRVAGFSVQDHADLAERIADWIIQRRAGLV